MKKRKNDSEKRIRRTLIFSLLLFALVVYIFSRFQLKPAQPTAIAVNSLEGLSFYYNGEMVKDDAALIHFNEQNLIAIDYLQGQLPEDYQIKGDQLLIDPSAIPKQILTEKIINDFAFADYKLHFPILAQHDNYYIDVQLLPLIANMKVVTDGEVLQIYSADYPLYYAFCQKAVPVYYGSDLKREQYVLAAGDKLYISELNDKYYQVIDLHGRQGYTAKKPQTIIAHKKYQLTDDVPQTREQYSKEQLTFNHFTNYRAELSYDFREKIKGLDTIIATAFSLTENGEVLCRMDKSYVENLQGLNYKVFAMLDNQFKPELTHKILSDEKAREKVIAQLDFYCKYFQLNGINIDFENVYLEDKDSLTTFIKELSARLKANGALLSVDATRPNGSDMWSRFIDRRAVAEYADYIIFMAYDEHWATSPTAGSVASLPWTESGIKLMLKEVPKEKLILGVPTYMRAYIVEKEQKENVLSSKAIAMNSLEKVIEAGVVGKNYDDRAEQNYYEVEDREGNYMRIWAEDEDSLSKRLDLLLKYDLSGIASWRLGLESDEFWQICNYKLK